MTIEEFEIKVLPVNSKLFQFARRLLYEREEAEDAVQEVFIKLWKHRKSLDKLDNIEAYAMRITRNHCLDRIKMKKNLILKTNDYKKENVINNTNPENLLELKETVNKVNKIINSLPEKQKTVIELRDRYGYTLEEIGEIMKMNAGNVRVCLSRARRKVREIIRKTYEYGSGENKRFAEEVL